MQNCKLRIEKVAPSSPLWFLLVLLCGASSTLGYALVFNNFKEIELTLCNIFVRAVIP